MALQKLSASLDREAVAAGMTLSAWLSHAGRESAAALVATEANRADLWALHRRALRHRLPITVPGVVYAQVWRDGAPRATFRGCWPAAS